VLTQMNKKLLIAVLLGILTGGAVALAISSAFTPEDTLTLPAPEDAGGNKDGDSAAGSDRDGVK
jgi:hypothetical protein